MAFTMPNTIVNESSRDARPIQANFAAITAALQNDFLLADGSIAATNPITAADPPSADNHLTNKAYVDSIIPVGISCDFTGDAAPAGWALAQGQYITIASYPLLYDLYGPNKYGADTGTQFKLPDLRSVFVVGKGSAAWSNTMGQAGGSKDAVAVTHSHTQVAHSHTTGVGYWLNRFTGDAGPTAAYIPNNRVGNGAVSGDDPIPSSSVTPVINAAGESGSDKNLPPYIVLNKIIRLG